MTAQGKYELNFLFVKISVFMVGPFCSFLTNKVNEY